MSTRDLQTLKSAALIISRTLGEVKDLQTDIQRIERDLQSTGTLKTASELQREIDQISSDM
jgi:DNA repair protein RAD50